jgi:hypothetical protein
MPRIDELLAHLTPNVLAKLEEARVAKDMMATLAATDAAGIARRSTAGGSVPVFPLSSELTAEQAALAEIIALEGLPCALAVMPTPFGAQQGVAEGMLRWLGRAAPSATEHEVEHLGRTVPLWRAMQEVAQDRASKYASWRALLGQLPADARLEALASLCTSESIYALHAGSELAWEIAAAMPDGEGTAWARRVLDAFDPDEEPELPQWLAFLTMVRANETLDAAWDASLPIAMGTTTEVGVLCAAALPEARREAAVMARLKDTYAHNAIQHALALAERFDIAALARFVIEKSERSAPHNRTRERAMLVAIGERHPNIAAVVAELLSPAPESAPKKTGPGLHLTNYRRPFAGTLDTTPPALRAQLEALIASDLDAEAHALDAFFGDALDEENAPMKALELLDVVNAETGAVEANLFLYPYGDGALVHAGTVNMIASIVQHAISPHPSASKPWMDDFARAWRTEAKTIGVKDPGHFDIG